MHRSVEIQIGQICLHETQCTRNLIRILQRLRAIANEVDGLPEGGPISLKLRDNPIRFLFNGRALSVVDFLRRLPGCDSKHGKVAAICVARTECSNAISLTLASDLSK